MRKRLFIFCVAALLVTACAAETDEVVKRPKEEKPVENNDVVDEVMSESLLVDPAKFHFVADWLTDTKIVYVERDEGYYKVNSFDLNTGETDTLYKDKSMIIDILIHPSKKYLLLHTSENSTSATVKILSMDGTIQDEIEVASTELAIEWNDMDPSLILLTAFHQDWTFDLFMYNGEESSLKILEIEDPFPKWFGKDQIAIGYVEDHVLDGGEILTFNPTTEKWGNLDVNGIVYFDTYESSLLTVRINEEGDARYTIMDLDGTTRSQWTLPAVSNYSEWVIPEVEWISKDAVVLSSPATGGQLDELTSPFRLLRVTEGQQEVIVEESAAGFLRCSPSGQTCLTGASAETVIDVETGEERVWLEFPK